MADFIPASPGDSSERTRMEQLWGVSNYTDLKTVQDAERALQISLGNDTEDSFSAGVFDDGVGAFEYLGIGRQALLKKTDWKFSVHLKTGEIEEFVVNGHAPFDCLMKVQYANGLQPERVARWNQNIDKAFISNESYPDLGTQEIDSLLLDDDGDYSQFLNDAVDIVNTTRVDPWENLEESEEKPTDIKYNALQGVSKSKEDIFSDTKPESITSSFQLEPAAEPPFKIVLDSAGYPEPDDTNADWVAEIYIPER